MPQDIHALGNLVKEISEQSTIEEIRQVCGTVFREIFGITSDSVRMDDFLGEALEFHRAPARENRLEEFGDVIATLMAFSAEQDATPSVWLKRTLEKIIRKHELYAKRGNKPNVAIYGGSFDPITNGHISVAKMVLNSNLGIQKVLFMPANEYFGAKTLAPAEDRAAMAKILPRIDPRMDYFGFEIENGLFSETVNTILRLLDSEFAQTHRFHLLISTELANSIPTWPRWEELVRLVPFITVPRIGYKPKLRNPWFLQHPHRYIDEEDATDLIDMSSTQVRQLFQEDRSDEAKRYLPYPIHQYIMERDLYQRTS